MMIFLRSGAVVVDDKDDEDEKAAENDDGDDTDDVEIRSPSGTSRWVTDKLRPEPPASGLVTTSGLPRPPPARLWLVSGWAPEEWLPTLLVLAA